MEMPSTDLHFSGCFNKERRRTECALFALTVPTLPRSTNDVERATGAGVIPPTMVKIMTLERHAPLEVNAIPSSPHAYNSPQHHVLCKAEPFCWFGKGSALLSLA